MSKTPKPPPEAGCPLWMVSFGDTISLLVTFFVMLISFAEFEEAKLLELLGALKGGFRLSVSESQHLGTSQESVRLQKNVGTQSSEVLLDKKEISKMAAYEMLQQKKYAANTIGSYDKGFIIRLLDEGMSFIMKTDTLFEQGTANLLPKKEEILGVIADLAITLPNEIRIVGVTPAEIQVRSSLAQTPWGLAAERAIVLKDALVRISGFARERFGISGRVEKETDRTRAGREDLPRDRMEIIIVGFRDLSRLTEQEVIIEDRWR